jgi:proteic killer suppression protein
VEVMFAGEEWERLAVDKRYTARLPTAVVRAYRKRLQAILAADDERDLIAVRGNRFEKMKGSRSHQHSMRLNDQYRLIVELVRARSRTKIRLVGIEDYH